MNKKGAITTIISLIGLGIIGSLYTLSYRVEEIPFVSSLLANYVPTEYLTYVNDWFGMIVIGGLFLFCVFFLPFLYKYLTGQRRKRKKLKLTKNEQQIRITKVKKQKKGKKTSLIGWVFLLILTSILILELRDLILMPSIKTAWFLGIWGFWFVKNCLGSLMPHRVSRILDKISSFLFVLFILGLIFF